MKSSNVAGHAFISYVREDSRQVDQLQQILETAGVRVWRDTADLWPGEDWRMKIRRAITDNSLAFIVCFSRASLTRGKSYQNEELTLAIEQLRLRRPDDPWLIPVRFDDCDIPDRDIGGGRTLTSIQHADLFGDRFDEGAARLVAAILRILGVTTAGFGADIGRLLRELDSSLAGAQRPRQADTTGALKNVAELDLKLTAVLSVIGDNARTLDASSEAVHKIVEDIRRALKQEAFVPGGLLDPSTYRDAYNLFEVTYAAEYDMYEAYVDALERYERRRVRDLSVAESDSDRLALVERRREYIPKLLAFQEQVKAILDYLAERPSSS